MPGNSRRTELQVTIQALTAIQYEIRSLVMVVQAPEEVLAEVHKLQVEAKTLMQSSMVDADAMAFAKTQADEKHVECCG